MARLHELRKSPQVLNARIRKDADELEAELGLTLAEDLKKKMGDKLGGQKVNKRSAEVRGKAIADKWT